VVRLGRLLPGTAETCGAGSTRRSLVLDVIFVAVTVALFAVLALVVRAAERL